MENEALLRQGRNLLLQLHKMLVNFEREGYEMMNGPVSSGQFLNLLLEHASFAWLKEFSNLIVIIDEMFTQKDGVAADAIDAELSRLRDLMGMNDVAADFQSRYQYALQESPEIAGKHAEIKNLLA